MSNRHEEELMRLRAENARLISANDTLVARIEDLTEGYALEDTCPRVQCRTTSRRLKNQCYDVQQELDTLQVKFTDLAYRAAQQEACCMNPVKETGHTRRQSDHCATCGAEWAAQQETTDEA